MAVNGHGERDVAKTGLKIVFQDGCNETAYARAWGLANQRPIAELWVNGQKLVPATA
jgi:hypothetical protein